MKTESIEIVDRGRGLQLSTSRITVQDLVPYFQKGSSYGEILRWIPTLTAEEIAVAASYYREHQADLDDEDRRIRAFVAEQVRRQRLRFPAESHDVRLARMKTVLRQRQQERNGAEDPGR
jgi:uncharacterized protein (DUF433 family)